MRRKSLIVTESFLTNFFSKGNKVDTLFFGKMDSILRRCDRVDQTVSCDLWPWSRMNA